MPRGEGQKGENKRLIKRSYKSTFQGKALNTQLSQFSQAAILLAFQGRCGKY